MTLIFTIALLCQVHPSIEDITKSRYRHDLGQMICQDYYLTCVKEQKVTEEEAMKICIPKRLQYLKGLKGGEG
jgi:hypothetical protein